jgi:hypothetical protein
MTIEQQPTTGQEHSRRLWQASGAEAGRVPYDSVDNFDEPTVGVVAPGLDLQTDLLQRPQSNPNETLGAPTDAVALRYTPMRQGQPDSWNVSGTSLVGRSRDGGGRSVRVAMAVPYGPAPSSRVRPRPRERTLRQSPLMSVACSNFLA